MVHIGIPWEYSDKQLETAPSYWCYHLGNTPRFMTDSELHSAAAQAMINDMHIIQRIAHGNIVQPTQLTKREAWAGGTNWNWPLPDVNMLMLNHAFSNIALKAAAPPKTKEDWMH